MARTKRKPYRQSRRFDSSCRCHGGCPWCEGNRSHATDRRVLTAEEQIAEVHNDLMLQALEDVLSARVAQLAVAPDL